MNRVYNFAAGPAMLPVPVLEKAQKEMLDYKGSGMSVMEMSHRSDIFIEIQHRAEATLKEVMNIPANYKVLFLQGGASLQFAMVPVNLFRKSRKADFIITGAWAKKAMKESKRIGEVKVIASSEDKNFTYIPEWKNSDFTPDADFFHITTNNTIFGTRFTRIPETGNVPLVADMSSNILSEQLDVSRFGLIYAGAQKNIGPAGEDLIGHEPESAFTMLSYKTHVDNDSAFNTPPCYSLYIAGLVFEWIKDCGGVEEIEKMNMEKAALLYDFLDNSKLFTNPVRREDRSIMNVVFIAKSEELNKKFVKEAEAAGFVTLKGHRSVGGMRASIYNAMPVEGVKKLVEFMKKFEKDNS
jgi:phosphoserine aminotransferase